VPAGPRSPHLFRALRAFCLGAFFELGRDLESGADVPVSLEEHGGPNRPTLYEYRPLIGSFVEARAERLGRRDDGTEALIALKDEPAAGIFAQAHAGERVGEDEALRRTILIPLLMRTAESCGSFDWDDVQVRRLLRGVSSAMSDEVDHLQALPARPPGRVLPSRADGFAPADNIGRAG